MLKQAILRGVIPFIIMSVISLIMYYQKIDFSQVKSTFIVGIIVAVVAAASVIYDIEKWSLFHRSIVHFLVMVITVFPCLLISGWFELKSITDYLKIFGIFLLCGIVFWSIGYFVFTKIINK